MTFGGDRRAHRPAEPALEAPRRPAGRHLQPAGARPAAAAAAALPARRSWPAGRPSPTSRGCPTASRAGSRSSSARLRELTPAARVGLEHRARAARPPPTSRRCPPVDAETFLVAVRRAPPRARRAAAGARAAAAAAARPGARRAAARLPRPLTACPTSRRPTDIPRPFDATVLRQRRGLEATGSGSTCLDAAARRDRRLFVSTSVSRSSATSAARSRSSRSSTAAAVASSEPAPDGPRIVDLSHRIRAGLVTYPGFPRRRSPRTSPARPPAPCTRRAPSSRWTSSR